MSIKHFKKDLNNCNEILNLNTNKSFINEKEIKKFYRMKNGEKIQYIEKSEIDIIEKMMINNEENNQITTIDEIDKIILIYLKDIINESIDKYHKYFQIHAICKILNLNNPYLFFLKSSLTHKELAKKNISILNNINFEDIQKSENINEICEEKIEENGLLNKLLSNLIICYNDELYYSEKYNILKNLFKDTDQENNYAQLEALLQIKLNIIEDFKKVISEIFNKIEKNKLTLLLNLKNNTEELND